MSTALSIDKGAFDEVFSEFCRLVEANSKGRFVSFDEGLPAAMEDYKPRLREHALTLLGAEEWTPEDVGSGRILKSVVKAIEIQDSRKTLTNNLVFWQNRFGHANRDHYAILDAQSNPREGRKLEKMLFAHFNDNADDGQLFEDLSSMLGRKYPLIAYLFFLRDSDQFMPIQPTGFDRVFKALNVNLVTRGSCSWENYSKYLSVLQGLRPLIATASGLHKLSLVDAHSFCWIYNSLSSAKRTGGPESASKKNDAGRVYGARDKSIVEMRMSVEATVKSSNGQLVEQKVKPKFLRMSSQELEAQIRILLDKQENKCSLTGLPLEYSGESNDLNMKASLDRIDSDGHYEEGNLQVVCRFINFWKGATDNEEFKRLLNCIRQQEASE